MNPTFDHHSHARRLNYLRLRADSLREHEADLTAQLAERARRPLLTRLFVVKSTGPDVAALRTECDETRASLAAVSGEIRAAEQALHAALHDFLVAEDATYRATVSSRRLYAELQSATADWVAALAGLGEPEARVRRGAAGLADNHGVDLPDVLRDALQSWHAACVPAAVGEARWRAQLTRFRRGVEGSVFVTLYLPAELGVFEAFDAGPGSAADKLALYEKITPGVARALALLAEAPARFDSGLAEFDAALAGHRSESHRQALESCVSQ